MIHFGPTHIIGFASIQDETFDWDQRGLNIIQGPNGFGKTKFINALVWVLWGRTLNGSVETWDFQKGSDYKGTKVKQLLWIDGIEFEVTRCKEYLGKIDGAPGKNRLIIKVDGKEPKKVRDKKDYQAYLNESLGYSFELFKNTIIFGQKLQRLISETGPNKKKVFDDAFEVTFIPKAKKLIERNKQTQLLELEKQNGIYEVIKTKIDAKAEALEQAEESERDFEKNREENIKREQDKIDGLKIEKKSNIYKNLSQDINQLTLQTKEQFKKVLSQSELLSKSKEQNTIANKISLLNSENEKLIKENNKLSFSRENPIKECERCKRPFTKHDHEAENIRVSVQIKHNEQVIKKNNKQIEIDGGILKGIEKELSSAISIEKIYNSNIKSLERLEGYKKDLDNLDLQIESGKANIKAYKAQSQNISTEKLTHELSELRAKAKPEKKRLQRILSDIKISNWLIDFPLSNSGLKAFIFNQMLDTVNERLDYYSTYIGFRVVFSIDMESAKKDLETYVYRGDQLVPYSDLSGGQQQAVDIATAFAIHDVVSEGKDCDLLIMDELFESLDKSNIEIITELIQDKSKDKCLFLVTHTDFSPTNANTIQVDYNNGITTISR